jgi:23S rRNA (cytidine1920-2'-O)/16S rRNA (cytidine1409-2'-O)-methyltransferase
VAQRRRLDSELVRRGLAPSRTRAQELLDAGRVTVAGAPAAKPARLVAADEAVVVLGPPARYVGRGGLKLEAALDHFAIPVAGRCCLDAGASTGGFTDCLLQRGAVRVWAVDVGHGQLHPRIRHDERVVVRERCNVRDLQPDQLDGGVALTVADLSFISLTTVAPALVRCTRERGELIVLVKPQFEAGRREVSAGRGIISDPAAWGRALLGVSAAFARHRAGTVGLVRSPLTGADGNVEFLLHLRRDDPGLGPPALQAAVGAVTHGAQPEEQA